MTAVRYLVRQQDHEGGTWAVYDTVTQTVLCKCFTDTVGLGYTRATALMNLLNTALTLDTAGETAGDHEAYYDDPPELAEYTTAYKKFEEAVATLHAGIFA